MVQVPIISKVNGSKVSKTGGAYFSTQHICSACDAAPDNPEKICRTANGVVKTAFKNLLATGRSREESARSALVVLRIHEPSLCACNMNFVKHWLVDLDQ